MPPPPAVEEGRILRLDRVCKDLHQGDLGKE
jgi:hypothetical protein